LPSSRSQRGGGSLDLVEIAGYGVSRSTDTGQVVPLMGGGCVEIEILLPQRRYDFLLHLFLLLCAAATGWISCFARAVGPTAAPEPDLSSLPSGRGTYIGSQSHRWRRLV
jgi:hypothetical protein